MTYHNMPCSATAAEREFDRRFTKWCDEQDQQIADELPAAEEEVANGNHDDDLMNCFEMAEFIAFVRRVSGGLDENGSYAMTGPDVDLIRSFRETEAWYANDLAERRAS